MKLCVEDMLQAAADKTAMLKFLARCAMERSSGASRRAWSGIEDTLRDIQLALEAIQRALDGHTLGRPTDRDAY